MDTVKSATDIISTIVGKDDNLYSATRKIRLLSSVVILLLGILTKIGIAFNSDNAHLLSFVSFCSNSNCFKYGWVNGLLIVGFVLLVLQNPIAYFIANLCKGEENYLRSWVWTHTILDIISVMHTAYYFTLSLYMVTCYLCNTDYQLLFWIPFIHFALFCTCYIYNYNYGICHKSYKSKEALPFCDANGETLYNGMKVYYEGKEYSIQKTHPSLIDTTWIWCLDGSTKLELGKIDYKKLIIVKKE